MSVGTNLRLPNISFSLSLFPIFFNPELYLLCVGINGLLCVLTHVFLSLGNELLCLFFLLTRLSLNSVLDVDVLMCSVFLTMLSSDLILSIYF